MKLLDPTPGLTWRERFESPVLRISSLSYECAHGKHFEVEVLTKGCGHRRIVAHTHSYAEHWRQMYDASERLIVHAERSAS